MGANLLLSPLAVFIVVFLTIICLSYLLSKLTFKPKKIPAGLTEPYACGENIPTHMIQPDYSQFFPFAFYFTILHVVALMVALVPTGTIETFVMALVYVLCAIIGLLVLYRR
jgi:hypothetical protein